MPRKTPTVPVPKDTTDIVYYHETCGGKATFGVAFFTDQGEPDVCPICDQPYTEQDQKDRIHRDKTDTSETLAAKRDELRRKRDERLPAKDRPDNPRDAKQAKIKELRDQLAALEAEDEPETREASAPIIPTNGRPPGIRLGP